MKHVEPYVITLREGGAHPILHGVFSPPTAEQIAKGDWGGTITIVPRDQFVFLEPGECDDGIWEVRRVANWLSHTTRRGPPIEDQKPNQEPPPDHEDFMRLKKWALRGTKLLREKRRRAADESRFLVIRTGVYRHDILDMLGTRDAAVARAEALSRYEKDKYHEMEIVEVMPGIGEIGGCSVRWASGSGGYHDIKPGAEVTISKWEKDA